MNEELELAIFSIIANSGEAKTVAISAMSMAREGKIAEARNKLKEVGHFKQIANQSHSTLVQKEAHSMNEGKSMDLSLLLIHAEDQMMSVETINILAEEIINLYEKLAK